METQQLQTVSANPLLTLTSTTKAERRAFTDEVIERIKEGQVSPLQMHIHVKCMEDIIKSLTSSEDYRALVLEEAQLHCKGFEMHNAKVTVKEAAATYDWSVCNDPILTRYENEVAELADAMKPAEDRLKTRRDWLKMAPVEGFEQADSESGEIVTIFPPSKSSTTTVAVTLK